MGLEDVEAAANLVQEAAHPEANIIFGATFDDKMQDEIRVTVIATGFDEVPPVQRDSTAAAPAVPAAPRAEAKPQGLFTAATEKKAAAETAPAPATADAEEDPFDSIFKIFNSK
jgi:cell division protein FtsZ